MTDDRKKELSVFEKDKLIEIVGVLEAKIEDSSEDYYKNEASEKSELVQKILNGIFGVDRPRKDKEGNYLGTEKYIELAIANFNNLKNNKDIDDSRNSLNLEVLKVENKKLWHLLRVNFGETLSYEEKDIKNPFK